MPSLPVQCYFVLHQVFPVVWCSGLEVYIHSDLPDLVLPLLDLLLMIPGPPAVMMTFAPLAMMILMTPAACDLLSLTPI